MARPHRRPHHRQRMVPRRRPDDPQPALRPPRLGPARDLPADADRLQRLPSRGRPDPDGDSGRRTAHPPRRRRQPPPHATLRRLGHRREHPPGRRRRRHGAGQPRSWSPTAPTTAAAVTCPAMSCGNRVALTKRPIVVRSVNGPSVTFASPGHRAGLSDFAVRCAFVGRDAVLSGFTLTNGYTRTLGAPAAGNNAAGRRLRGSPRAGHQLHASPATSAAIRSRCLPDSILRNCRSSAGNQLASTARGGVVRDAVLDDLHPRSQPARPIHGRRRLPFHPPGKPASWSPIPPPWAPARTSGPWRTAGSRPT
jgi:hypothetical protein